MPITKTTNWIEATQAVQAAQTILVVTHVAPDGDAIGSLVASANLLRALGKSVDCAVDGGVPSDFHFLPGADAVRDELDEEAWDLMISVDASDEERTGKVGEYGRAKSKAVINLDHHTTNVMFGDIFLVDPEAVSATEVIFNWLREMRITLTSEIAIPLLTGLVTDTLGFRTSNVTANTLGIAQELMQAGASLTEITARTLDTRSYLAVNVWKRALPSVRLHKQGVISAEVTQEDLKRAGLTDVSDYGLVGFLIQVNEAMIAIVFKETTGGNVELSLRSKPGYDVAQVAYELGGGGHKQASGATVPGPLDEAKKRVLPLLQDAARQGKLVIG